MVVDTLLIDVSSLGYVVNADQSWPCSQQSWEWTTRYRLNHDIRACCHLLVYSYHLLDSIVGFEEGAIASFGGCT